MLQQRKHDRDILPSPKRPEDAAAEECARGKVIGGSSRSMPWPMSAAIAVITPRWAGSAHDELVLVMSLPYFAPGELGGDLGQRLSRRRWAADHATGALSRPVSRG